MEGQAIRRYLLHPGYSMIGILLLGATLLWAQNHVDPSPILRIDPGPKPQAAAGHIGVQTESASAALLFADDFNAGALDLNKWNKGTNSGNQAAVVNNALELSTLNNVSSWVITRNAYAARHTTVTVKVVQPNGDGDLGITPTYTLSSPYGIYTETNWYRFSTYLINGVYRLYVAWKKNGVAADIDVTGNLVISGAIYLRLRFDDTNIHFEASLDGATWTDTYNEPFALPGYSLDTSFYYELAAYKTWFNGVLIADDFSITSSNPQPLQINAVTAQNISSNSARITWQTNGPADAQVEYGLTASYGDTSARDANLVLSHVLTLSNLLPNTTYHYRVKSNDAGGNLAMSGDLTFTTLPNEVTPPVISNVAANNITTASATINWTTNDACDSQVEYGLTTSYGFLTPPVPALVTSHGIVLSGLQLNTTYHYRVKSKNAAGGLAVSGDFTFATLPVAKKLQFVDITANAGVAGISDFGGHAILFADVNNDNWVDMYVTHTNFDPNSSGTFLMLPDELFINNGNNTFTERAVAAGVNDPGQSHGGVFVDIDNDGDFDLFNGQRGPHGNRLYKNNGDGTFTEVTNEAGIFSADRRTISVLAVDIDNDGDMDLFSANWGVANEMYVNDGAGRFTLEDRGLRDVEPDPSGTMAATAVDVDNDGDMDIFYAKRTDQGSDACKLYINDGTGHFTDQAAARGVAVTGLATGAVFADLDNDGDLDMLLATLSGTLQVYRNRGDGYFSDETGLHNIALSGYSINAGDLDNDGDADIFIYQNFGAGAVWLNDGTGRFTQLRDAGLDRGAADARAASLADIDNDGDLDVAVTHIKQPTVLYRNDLNTAGTPAQNYLQIILPGPNGSVGRFGSKFYLYEAGHLDDPAFLTGYQQLTSCTGTLSQNSPVIHFGVAPNKFYDLHVRTLEGGDIIRQNIAPGQRLLLASAPDTAATRIANVAANNLSATTATITWTTNRAADSQVEYGLTSAHDSSSLVQPALLTSHRVLLANLQANTTYHYRAKSKDAAGRLAVSGDFTFTTTTLPVSHLIFADDFDTSRIDANKWRAGANAGNQSTITNQALELRSQGNESGWIITRQAYPSRHTTASVKIIRPNDDGDVGLSPTYNLTSLYGIYDQPNFYRFYTYRNGNQGPYRLYVQWKKNGVENGFDVTGNMVIGGPVYLRLRCDDSNIHFEASLEGERWVNTYNETFALPGYTLDSAFYYELAAYRTTTKGVLAVDDFAITSDSAHKSIDQSPAEVATAIPQAFALQNYPNPFMTATRINFVLPQDAEIQLSVFDLLGHEVRELIAGSHSAGNHDLLWDDNNRHGEELRSGVYLLRLRYRTGKSNAWSQIVRQMLMLK